MPELPEVETIANQLNQMLSGNIVKNIEILNRKSFHGSTEVFIGKVIASISRKAKMAIISFENIEARLLVHLKMTGQLILIPSATTSPQERIVGGHPTSDWVKSLPSKHTRVIITFTNGSTLYFNDMRKFGWIKQYDPINFQTLLASKPPDVTETGFTAKYLYQVLQTSRRPVKAVILDQAKMGGIGNIYANDALWLAKVNPSVPASKVSRKSSKALHQAIIQVIAKGIELGGATESDYVDARGMGGSYQLEFLTYKQDKQTCKRLQCSGIIVKEKVAGRGTYWCPTCQR